jgi:hypothetical protein
VRVCWEADDQGLPRIDANTGRHVARLRQAMTIQCFWMKKRQQETV